MINKIKIFAGLLLVMAVAASAIAQESRVSLKPNFKAGQQDRYMITVSVDTQVSPAGSNGLAGDVRRELTATVLLETLEVSEGHVTQQALIEAASFRETIDGVESSSKAAGLAGQKIEFTLGPTGRLVKCSSLPQQAGSTGLAEMIFNLMGWLPSRGVAVGETWEAGAYGPAFFSYNIADISKGATAVYKLVAAGDTASIEGDITLNQKGVSMLSTSGGPLNIGVIAAGKGTSRFDYDASNSRVIRATTETRLEGRLGNTAPSGEGQKPQPREGAFVETAKYSVKLVL